MAPVRARAVKKEVASNSRQKSSLTAIEDPESEMLLKSQGLEDSDFAQMLKRALAASQARRQNLQNQITKKHEKRVKMLRSDIAAVYTTHEEKAASIRRTLLERLHYLHKRRLHLEAKMIEIVRNLENAYIERSNELSYISTERITEIKETQERIASHLMRG